MELFSIAKAQGLDDVASPTIPFDPPDGPVASTAPTTPPVITGPNIQLSTTTTQVKIGEVFRVEVIVDSEEEEIREYGIQIQFSNELVEVVDFDTTTPGGQIDFLDPFSAPTENLASNENGIIAISATSEVGSTTISERTVAAIEFRGIAEGFAEISINNANSLLIDVNSTNVLESTNSANVTITTEDAPSDTLTPLPTTPGGPVLPSTTPDTALFDGSNPYTPIAFGVILMLSGYYIWKRRSEYDEREKV